MQSVCCILVLLAFVGPRIVLVLLWIFTNYLSRAYDNFLVPLLGLFFLPATTIGYAVAQNDLGGLSPLGIGAILLGLLFDLGVIGGGARRRF